MARNVNNDDDDAGTEKSPFSTEYLTAEGNIASEPKDISKNPDRQVVVFNIACPYRTYDSSQGEMVEDLFYRNVRVANFFSPNILASLKVGDRVVVEGSVIGRRFTRRDGTEEHGVTIIAQRVSPSMRFYGWERLENTKSKSSSRQQNDDEEDEEEEKPRRGRRRRDDSSRSGGRDRKVESRGDDDDDWDDE